jgi:hypothetical protein
MYVAWIESRDSPENEYHNLMNLACSPSHDISTSNPHRRTPQIIVQAFKWDCLLMLMSSPGCCVHVEKTPWGIWPELSVRFVPTSSLKTWLRVTGLSGRCANSRVGRWLPWETRKEETNGRCQQCSQQGSSTKADNWRFLWENHEGTGRAGFRCVIQRPLSSTFRFMIPEVLSRNSELRSQVTSSLTRQHYYDILAQGMISPCSTSVWWYSHSLLAYRLYIRDMLIIFQPCILLGSYVR